MPSTQSDRDWNHHEDDRTAAVTRRAGVVMGGTLLSRVLGAVRDPVIAASFSVAATDSFFVAFTIPNAFRQLLGEGAASAAVVPIYTETRQKEGQLEAAKFIRRLLGAALVVLLVVCLLGVIAAPLLVRLYAGGYAHDSEKFALTVELTRWTFPYLFFMGLVAIAVGVQHAHRVFFTPSVSPALLNVAMIAAALTLPALSSKWDMHPATALALGVLMGGALQLLAQAPSLRRLRMLHTPMLPRADTKVKEVGRRLTPLLLGLGVYQANVILSRLFASFLPDGAQSYLYYGQRLTEIPQGLIAMALASAMLPSISRLRAQGDQDKAGELLTQMLRLTALFTLPAAAILTAAAHPLASVVFGHGEFHAGHVAEASHSLVWLGFATLPVSLARVLVSGFHAYGDTRAPVICSLGNLVAFGISAPLLMPHFRHVGIAQAFLIAALVQSTLLYVLFSRRHGELTFLRNVGRLLLPNVLVALLLIVLLSHGPLEVNGADRWLAKSTKLLVSLLLSGAVWLAGLRAACRKEWTQLLSWVRPSRHG